MNAEPLISWPEPLLELAGFLAVILAAGAVGFRLTALRERIGPLSRPVDAEERATRAAAARRAALLGLAGAMIGFLRLATALPELAERRHVTVPELVTGNLAVGVQLGLAVLALAGFAAALGRARAGWWLAAAAVLLAPLRGALTGQWERLVNPLHELAAGLWIGTLFVLVVAGLGPLLRSDVMSERRGQIAADMVNAFSPLALGSAMALVVLGVVTAARHLHTPVALWTTPYGFALMAKLAAVAVVFGFGAANAFVRRRRMSSVSGALALRRSAVGELVAAAAVLLITAVLVSLPAPKPPVG